MLFQSFLSSFTPFYTQNTLLCYDRVVLVVPAAVPYPSSDNTSSNHQVDFIFIYTLILLRIYNSYNSNHVMFSVFAVWESNILFAGSIHEITCECTKRES